ncbi:MAG TPA: FlgD immunoglobulin-like domain containing protein, partial [bacterium]|nr:FlgD immunoglobulin-like domain containing protein [bacterium]
TVTRTPTASPTPSASPTITPSFTAVAEAGTGQPYPNPFWPLRGGRMTLQVGVATPGQISVKVYTLAGDLVKVLGSGSEPNGTVPVTWDGTNSQGDTVASGMYMVLVQAPGLTQTRLVGVLK